MPHLTSRSCTGPAVATSGLHTLMTHASPHLKELHRSSCRHLRPPHPDDACLASPQGAALVQLLPPFVSWRMATLKLFQYFMTCGDLQLVQGLQTEDGALQGAGEGSTSHTEEGLHESVKAEPVNQVTKIVLTREPEKNPRQWKPWGVAGSARQDRVGSRGRPPDPSPQVDVDKGDDEEHGLYPSYTRHVGATQGPVVIDTGASVNVMGQDTHESVTPRSDMKGVTEDTHR
ncbi:hypothetical protein NDU88_000104 [Pleurodeles waltl]|uniref:Uncharacterized protein n=1 Tax=Pleurodeles waltl TaxID=8319 RepID=A0AAV7NZW0_PLEWA|nr:hypothetical protein NDU88_000104 [Pleurodeles waltl]